MNKLYHLKKKLYHLKNNYNDYDEFTSDVEKIRKIYINECLQVLDNNIYENSTKKEVENIRFWLYESMKAIYGYNADYFVKELNEKHNWLIETYIEEE